MSVQWHVVIELFAGGKVFRLARRKLAPVDFLNDTQYHFDGLIEHGTNLPVFGVASNQFTVTVPTDVLDVQALAEEGIYFPGAKAAVWLWKLGSDWSERKPLVIGTVKPSSYERGRQYTKMIITDLGEQDDTNFPPHVYQQNSFNWIADSEVGKAYNVIYGYVTEIPMTQVSEVVENQTTPIHFSISCHRMGGKNAIIRPEGEEVRATSVAISLRSDNNGVPSSEIEIPIADAATGGDRNYICSAGGHTDEHGSVIERLGDVVIHAIQTYSGLSDDYLDWDRLSKFRPLANRIKVASIFGGGSGQTLVSTLQSRYEDIFGIKIDWRNGKLGADSLYYDPKATVQKQLVYGRELFERFDPVTIIGEERPYSYFELLYDPNLLIVDPATNMPVFRKRLVRDHRTDARCNRAFSHYGELKFPVIQVVDVNTEHDAGAILDWKIDSLAIQRTQVSYRMGLDAAINLFRLEKYQITDYEMRWTNVDFRLETIASEPTDTAIVTFSSYGFMP